ncbi:hypothetical protein [Sporolactobacillus sp. KGMB 08714]|uniref:hypothetical protein n=1 Tax=Sporolactobacillus sp. KGMB 08714 TaxID=3064704 RepID=UPI002FBEE752
MTKIYGSLFFIVFFLALLAGILQRFYASIPHFLQAIPFVMIKENTPQNIFIHKEKIPQSQAP